MRAWTVLVAAALFCGCLAPDPGPAPGLSFEEAQALADAVVEDSDHPVDVNGDKMAEDGRGGQWFFRYDNRVHTNRREVQVENGRAVLVGSNEVRSNEFLGVPVYCHLPASLDSPAVVRAAMATDHWKREAGELGTVEYTCVGGNGFWTVEQAIKDESGQRKHRLFLDPQGSLLAYDGGATYTDGVGVDQTDEQVDVPGSIQFETHSAVRLALRAEQGTVPVTPSPGGPLAIVTTLKSPSGQAYEIPWDAGLTGSRALEWVTQDLAPSEAAGTWTWTIPAPAVAGIGQVRVQVCTGLPNVVVAQSSAACALLAPTRA